MAEIIGRVGWRNFVTSSTTLWNGLTNYYSGDSTANDSKGSSNADLINGATYATGKINNGFSFDGINDALVLTPNPLIDGISTDSYKSFSISCWIKPVFNTTKDPGIFITQSPQGLDGYRLVLLRDGRLFYRGFYSYESYGADDIYTSSCIVTGNSYHIVVIHEDGVGTKIYCNNILVGSSSSTEKQFYRSTAAFRIGGDPITGYITYYQGSIDEFGLWNRAISTSEKTELYNAGAGKQYVAPVVSLITLITTGLILNLDASNALSYPGTGTVWTDLSGNGNNGTLVNGTSYSSANGGTMVFDGINDYIRILTGLPTSNTLSVWFKQPAATGGGLLETNSLTGVGSGSPQLFVGLGANYLRTYGEPYGYSPESAYTPTNWYNVTITSSRNIYMNGVLTATKNNMANYGYNSAINIGVGYPGFFNGSVPVVHLYNRVLTQAEITANFNALKGRYGL
jgi:hypothetical protein